jgi:acyl-CoA synthetase (AMP-forming)/AMP-acid ligase II/predicted naringenin-chalcone synthase/acyl carrier protein
MKQLHQNQCLLEDQRSRKWTNIIFINFYWYSEQHLISNLLFLNKENCFKCSIHILADDSAINEAKGVALSTSITTKETSLNNLTFSMLLSRSTCGIVSYRSEGLSRVRTNGSRNKDFEFPILSFVISTIKIINIMYISVPKDIKSLSQAHFCSNALTHFASGFTQMAAEQKNNKVVYSRTRAGSYIKPLAESTGSYADQFAIACKLLTSFDREQSLIHVLQKTAIRHPLRQALLWIGENGREESRMTYGQFFEKIMTLAQYLKTQQNVQKGQRVILCFAPGLSFYVSFWACIALGAIAVPICPFDPRSKEDIHLNKTRNIIKDSGAKLVLTDPLFHEALQYGNPNDNELLRQILECRWVVVNESNTTHTSASPIDSKEIIDSKLQASDVAFLQYTSGSTGEPKGVVLTHFNLLANCASCCKMTHVLDTEANAMENVTVSWLPHFHDMGLIGFHVTPILFGGCVVSMSPITFLRSPKIWLETCSQFTKVITGVPPFALQQCVKTLSAPSEQTVKRTLKLQSIICLFLGAEPILPEYLEQFSKEFAEVGFNPNVYTPSFGLAESVLFVTGKANITSPAIQMKTDMAAFQNGWLRPENQNDNDEKKSSGVVRVSSGDIVRYVDASAKILEIDYQFGTVVIVDPTSQSECQDGVIGEIYVVGPSKANGYWERKALSDDVFHVRIGRVVKAETQTFIDRFGNDFLRTGDLGAVVNRQLFVTGRSKEMMIVNGVKYWPTDFAADICSASPFIRPGRVAVFSVPKNAGNGHANGRGTESIVVVAELKEQSSEVSLLNNFVWFPLGWLGRNGATLVGSAVRGLGFHDIATKGSFAYHQMSVTLAKALLDVDQLTNAQADAIVKSIRLCVAHKFKSSVTIDEVFLVRSGTLTKTSSGKMMHVSVRDAYLAKTLFAGQERAILKHSTVRLPIPSITKPSAGPAASEAFFSAPVLKTKTKEEAKKILTKEQIRDRLLPELAKALGVEIKEIDMDRPLMESGMDSAEAVRLFARLQDELKLPNLNIFEFSPDSNIHDVIAKIDELQRKTSNTNTKPEEKAGKPLRDFGPDRLTYILGMGCLVPKIGGPQSQIIPGMAKIMGLDAKQTAQFIKIGEGTHIESRYMVQKELDQVFFECKGLGNDALINPRQAVYKREAPLLATEAAQSAIKDWGQDKGLITHVVAVTCTGVIVPGLEFEVMTRLGLSASTERLSIQFMGCFGAISGLKAAVALAQVNPSRNRVLVVCCELCSLHMQMNTKVDNLIGSALFSDGAGAFIVGCQPTYTERPQFEVHNTASVVIPKTLDYMGWDLSNTGLLIGLHKLIPKAIYDNIQPFVDRLLGPNIQQSQCTFAIHPGGPMIIKAICEVLKLRDDEVDATWSTLRNFGNMSSATLVFVWDYLRRHSSREWIPSLSFGPGLNVEGALLRSCRRRAF